jgi:hypothetical protein
VAIMPRLYLPRQQPVTLVYLTHFNFSTLNSSHHSDLSIRYPFASNKTPSSFNSLSFDV